MTYLVESLRIFLAIHSIVLSLVAAPVPCDHEWGIHGNNLGIKRDVYILEEELKDPPMDKILCVKCFKKRQEVCLHDMISFTDSSPQGDFYCVYGTATRCPKCGLKTPTVPWRGL